MRRILGLILLTVGAVALIFAVIAWRTDRQQLKTWYPAEARISGARVVEVEPMLPYTLGGYGAGIETHYARGGDTVRGLFVDPVWARRSRARAYEDVRVYREMKTIHILVDPIDANHLSIRPDEPVYYYRDAWQLALLGVVLIIAGAILTRSVR